MGRPTVIVFLRAPRLGAVKQRLAQSIGDAAALEFYVATTRNILRRIGGHSDWDTHLAVTPDDAAKDGDYWPSKFKRFPQGLGNLGERMVRAIGRFPNRPVALVGSDIPDLSECQIKHAFAELLEASLTFGPARDGGYWLVGVRDSKLVSGLFKNVRWSSCHALADTLANVADHRVTLLEELEDVDDAKDYARWQARSDNLKP